jgi:hypothetical protein
MTIIQALEVMAQQLTKQEKILKFLSAGVPTLIEQTTKLNNTEKHNVLLRDALTYERSLYQEAGSDLGELGLEALESTQALGNCIICDAKPAIWLSIDGQDFSYQQSAYFTTPLYQPKE